MKSPDLPADVVQYVSFYIGEALYGLDIRLVKEVNTNTHITSVPLCHTHIAGLVNIRGQIVLVIDSSVLLTGNRHVVSANSQLVILKTAQDLERSEGSLIASQSSLPDKPVAFLVDSVGEVTRVARTLIEKPPPHMPRERAKFVTSVVKTDQFFLIVLDPAQLIAGETDLLTHAALQPM